MRTFQYKNDQSVTTVSKPKVKSVKPNWFVGPKGGH